MGVADAGADARLPALRLGALAAGRGLPLALPAGLPRPALARALGEPARHRTLRCHARLPARPPLRLGAAARTGATSHRAATPLLARLSLWARPARLLPGARAEPAHALVHRRM